MAIFYCFLYSLSVFFYCNSNVLGSIQELLYLFGFFLLWVSFFSSPSQPNQSISPFFRVWHFTLFLIIFLFLSFKHG